MNLSRRSFLGGALVVSALAAAPTTVLSADIPVIHGDGIRDDWAGLQAAVDGKPFRVGAESDAYVLAHDGRVVIQGGNFVLSETLHIRSDHVTITDCMINYTPWTGYAINIHGETAFRFGGKGLAA